MNKALENHIENQMHLTQSQLIRYSEGTMNDAEMHQVEKHLLSCGLCCDAFEGIELIDARKKRPAMESLRSRFRTRMRRDKRVPIVSYWKWAAIAAIFLLSSVTLFVLLNNNIISEKEIATQDNNGKENIPHVASEPLIELKNDSVILKDTVVVDNLIAFNKEKNEGESNKEKLVAIPETTNVLSQPATETEVESPAAAVNSSEDEMFESVIMDKEAVAGLESRSADSSPLERGKMAAKKTMGVKLEETAPSKNQKQITGKVLDEAGEPVPGANVIFKGSPKGTVSDVSGEYSLMGPDSTFSLQVSAIGYTSKEINIKDTDSSVTTTLHPDAMALSEIVVIGYGTETRQERTGAAAVSEPGKKPRPVNGYKKFNKYIRQNLITEEAARIGVNGSLSVSFVVQKDGSVSDFEIVAPLGHGLDEKVIQLIKEGPEWIPASKNNAFIKEQVTLAIPVAIKKK